MSAPVDAVIEALRQAGYNPQQSGDSWKAQCPAHDDRTPSLSINIGNDNKALLHCHAGCPPEAIILKLGLTYADLFEKNEAPRTERKIEAVYPYHNADGDTAFEVVRYSPKAFRQRVPQPDGNYEWNLKGLQPEAKELPYRLPDIQKAVADNPLVPVWIVEGEKDANALWQAGLPATCNAGGAGKWTENHTTHLVRAGVRSVRVLADRDDPGRKHATAVVKSLSDHDITADASEPSCEDGCKDAAMLLSHHDECLDQWIAPLRVEEPTGDEKAKPKAKPRKTVSCSLDEIAYEKPDWLLQGWLAKGKFHMIAGRPGVGKTTAATAMVAALTRGQDLMGNPTSPRRCGWLTWEEDLTTVKPRLEAAGVQSKYIRPIKTPAGPLALSSDLDDLRAQIEEDGLDLLVADGIGYGVDGESYQAVGKILADLADIAGTTGCAVLGIAHTAKGKKSSEAPVIGSTAWTSVPRIVAVVGGGETSTERHLAISKTNFKPPEKSLAFDISEDTEMEVGVAVNWRPSEMKAIDLLTDPAERSERNAVDTAIREYLKESPLTRKEINERLKEDGLDTSDRTLSRAIARVGAARKHNGFGSELTYSLPNTATSTPRDGVNLASNIGQEMEEPNVGLPTEKEDIAVIMNEVFPGVEEVMADRP